MSDRNTEMQSPWLSAITLLRMSSAEPFPERSMMMPRPSVFPPIWLPRDAWHVSPVAHCALSVHSHEYPWPRGLPLYHAS